MKKKRSARLACSMSGIGASCPVESLGSDSRYVILADLRMGDGGNKDELAKCKKALCAILGLWYLPRGYTLVLNGDTEDLNQFWLKDIIKAWPGLYAVFDSFNQKDRLRKIVGERDLTLLRNRSYPYDLSQGFRLDDGHRSILLLHGHQASPPYVGRDYLTDYMVHWLGSPKRSRSAGIATEKSDRIKAEHRLVRASASLGLIAIQGHTHRPLFESMTNRASLKAEMEKLLRGSTDDRDPRPPCLFSPGRIIGSKTQLPHRLRMLEIEGACLKLTRWNRANNSEEWLDNSGSVAIGQSTYVRFVTRAAPIDGVFDRIDALAGRRCEGSKGDLA